MLRAMLPLSQIVIEIFSIVPTQATPEFLYGIGLAEGTELAEPSNGWEQPLLAGCVRVYRKLMGITIACGAERRWRG